MSNLEKYLDVIKKNVSSLDNNELRSLIDEYKNRRYKDNDEWWKRYSKFSRICIEPDIKEEYIDSCDPYISRFIEEVDLDGAYDLYLSQGVLDNCSKTQKEFIKLIDEVGY